MRTSSYFALLVLPLAFAGCGDAASPEAVCKHLATISGKSKSPEELAKCKTELVEIHKTVGKEKAAKMNACMIKAKDTRAAMQCADIGAGKEGAVDEYIAKSKSSEPKQYLRKMYDGARAYYMDPQASAASMTVVAKQFPAPSIGPTPPLAKLCANGADKFMPDAADWEAPVWMALNFAMQDPHYYSYEYKVEGEGAAQKFTVLAYGDLDCDGEHSTFKISGSINEDGDPVPAGDVEATNELE